MKVKHFVFATLLALTGGLAMADDGLSTSADPDAIESLDAMGGEVMDFEGITPQQSRFVKRLVGRLIGRAADAAFNDRDYKWDRHYRDRHPYDRDEGRSVSCYAENRRGHMFRGTSRGSARKAQDRAFQACYSRSDVCRPMGCEYR